MNLQFDRSSLGKSRIALLRVVAAVSLLLAAAPAWAQRDLRDIPPPDPELERASFIVADGFEVNLFAADPMLAKPIQMNFDSAGRLWVASSEIYPHILPGQPANDKIIVLEDADGDGVAENTSVFADGLLIPTGVEPGDGGAYVANSTELVHLRDADGDGRADQRRVLLSGFGTEDTHHILHTFRWGPDGMLYFNQSIYIHSHLETPYGVRRLGGGGIWHFRPETMQLDVFVRGFVNPWGHHFDAWGQSLATDGAYVEGVNYCFPGATFFSAPGAVRILQGLNPGSPKHCGLEIVSGSHLPDDWQGNVIANDFRAHRVCRFVISEDRSGFASREEVEVIKTDHVAFRPIDVKMGPDGAIYVADWYNPIIQHGEVDFRDERRDHTHGRIWRITAKDRPLVPRPQLVGASVADLLAALRAPEDWTRQHAKRQLKERGAAAVLPELASWTAALDPADPQVELLRLEALWVYQALNVVEPDLLVQVLRSLDHRARAAATRVVYHWLDRLPNALALLTPQVADDHPRVRLEAVRALARVGTPLAVQTALTALDRPLDSNLDFALWLTARETAAAWLPAVQAGTFDFGGQVKHLEFALTAVDSPAVVPALVGLLQRGEVPPENELGVLRLIASLGSAEDMGLVFSMAVIDDVATADKQIALLTTLLESSSHRHVIPTGDLALLGKLLAHADERVAALAAQAIGRWQVVDLLPRIADLAQGEDASSALRAAACAGLASLNQPQAQQLLADLAAGGATREIRQTATMALAAVDLPAAARQAALLLADADERADPAPLVEALLQRKGGAAALATTVSALPLPEDAAKLAIRAVRASALADEALVEALRAAGGLGAAQAQLTPEEVQQLVAQVRERGDPARGEQVFRRVEQGCLKCHAIAGAGGQVGPDLSSIGGSAQIDYLIESLLLPSAKIKEGYQSLVVVTDDGRVLTGVKVRDTGSELLLRTAEDAEIAIPLDSIDEQANGHSLMPVGLVETLTRSELFDLVRFLSELGKLGPYSVGQARVVRRWDALSDTPAGQAWAATLQSDQALPPELQVLWQRAYSEVSGYLPLTATAPLPTSSGGRQSMLRFSLQVSTPGTVELLFDNPTGLSLWVASQPVAVAATTALDLPSGLVEFTVACDQSVARGGLRIELREPADSPARAQIVGGK